MQNNSCSFCHHHQFVYVGLCMSWQILFGLATATAEELGFTSVVVPGYKIGRGLGYGTFCDVNTCRRTYTHLPLIDNTRRNEDELAMKVFDSLLTPLMDKEVEVLRALSTSTASEHVLRLIDYIRIPTDSDPDWRVHLMFT